MRLTLYYLFRQAMALTVFLLSTASVRAYADYPRARLMWQRLTTSYGPKDEPRVLEMAAKIAAGDRRGAAAIATADDNFIDKFLVPYGLRLSSANGSTATPYNSVVALLQLIVRTDQNPGSEVAESGAAHPGDIRQLLYANWNTRIEPPAGFTGSLPLMMDNDNQAISSDPHHREIVNRGWSAKAVLRKQMPQYSYANTIADYAGLWTLGYMAHLYTAGTNRRPVDYLFSRLLCKRLEAVKDLSMPSGHVRQDVARVSPDFQQKCIGCHGGIDALSLAFAFLDVGGNGNLRFLNDRADKYPRPNTVVYPFGFSLPSSPNNPSGAAWVNNFTQNHNQALGWQGPTTGIGIRSLGRMVANSRAFAECLTRNVWLDVCRRPMSESEEATILGPITDRGLVDQQYRFSKLVEEVAAEPTCLDSGV